MKTRSILKVSELPKFFCCRSLNNRHRNGLKLDQKKIKLDQRKIPSIKNNEKVFDEANLTTMAVLDKPPVMSARKLRRLLHNKRVRLTFNRLVKNDLRKIFPSMYINVLNGGDFKVVEEFFCRYMKPHCEVTSHMHEQFGLPTLYFDGPQAFVEDVKKTANNLPDFALVPLGSRIVRRLHEDTSIVELYTILKGTHILFPPAEKSENNDTAVIIPSILHLELKMKVSFHMNNDGCIVKVVASPPPYIPLFMSNV